MRKTWVEWLNTRKAKTEDDEEVQGQSRKRARKSAGGYSDRERTQLTEMVDEILSMKHQACLKEDFYLCLYQLGKSWAKREGGRKGKIKPTHFDTWFGSDIQQNLRDSFRLGNGKNLDSKQGLLAQFVQYIADQSSVNDQYTKMAEDL